MFSSDPSKIKETINEVLAVAKSSLDRTSIAVVANVKGETNTENYENFSVETDFFSGTELNEIITAFRNFGFYVQVYTDEVDFINSVTTKEFEKLPGKNKLVYNTSQKGVGAARQSLIPAFCKTYKIPIIGSNAYVSSLARHKYHYNKLLAGFHSNIPKSWQFDSRQGWLLGERPEENLKVILKPIYEAASIGISTNSVVTYDPTKDIFIGELSEQFKQPIVAEEFIEGYEVEVPIFFSKDTSFGLGPVGIGLYGNNRIGDKILDYNDVYEDKYSFFMFNEFNGLINNNILACAVQSGEILGMEDYGRIDFRIKEGGEFYLMDITTSPHTVLHSSCNFAFKNLGFQHSELMSALAGLAIKRQQLP